MTKSAINYPSRFPDTSQIIPGQNDEALEAFLVAKKWFDRSPSGEAKVKIIRSRDAACLVYAGILTRTEPKREDSLDPEQFRRDHAAWRAACTERQRELLKAAADHAHEKRLAQGRKAYADQQAELGLNVRPYNRQSTPDHQRELGKARQKRYMDKMSPEDRKAYERLRKAAQRAARKAGNVSGTAVEAHTAHASSLEALIAQSKSKGTQRPSLAVSDQWIEELRDELQFTPEELAEIEAHKEFD